MLSPVTIALIVLFVALLVVAFVGNAGARREKGKGRRPANSGASRRVVTFIVQIALSVVVAGGSTYLLLTGKGSEGDRSAFFALLGGVVGFWLRT
jgi:Na+/proline symporter